MTTHRDQAHSSASRRLASKKPTLFIEVKLNDSANDDPFIRTDEIRDEVQKWLTDNFLQVKVAQHFDTSSLPCGKFIRCLKIVEHSKSTVYPDENFYILAENDLDIAVYSLFHGEDDEFSPNGEENPSHFTVTQLPHKTLDGLWESLIYAEPIPESLLRIMTRMTRISKLPRLNPAVIYWHNIFLLYGPPGSGKTTLAQALAQKLCIRLGHMYSATKLVEVNSHTLLSKWFGESSKFIGKLFETISTISSDESLLTVVLIDEVETLAGSREKASLANECSDAIRSTNELLQGLDRLRKRPNVVFICTSNLIDSMDTAFIDRCGIKQCVGTPNVECAYEILRSVINELIKADLVFFDPLDIRNEPTMQSADNGDPVTIGSSPARSSSSLPHTQSTPLRSREIESHVHGPVNLTYIPDLEWVNIHLFDKPVTAPWELRRIARIAEGLSGRTLRRLPILAMAKYTVEEPCNLRELLVALKKVVKEEDKDSSENDARPSEDGLADTDQLNDLSMDIDGMLGSTVLDL